MHLTHPSPNSRRRLRALVGAACAVPVVLSILACPGPGPRDAGGPDLYKLAVNGAPGGALLSVFGFSTGTGPAQAYLAGGYVGVDHAMVTDGHVGRLVHYNGAGQFTTVCTTDEVLWWTTGFHDPSQGTDFSENTWTIYAMGEGGRVIRYRNHTCETLTVDVTYPQGLPTFWGAVAVGLNDLWLVGGSALPNGPKGVLVHYDGMHFTQDSHVPTEASTANLYKIALTRPYNSDVPQSAIVVGERATVLRRNLVAVPDDPTWTLVPTGARSQDNRLFTVTCARGTENCAAVGGSGTGLVVSSSSGTWTSPSSVGSQVVTDLPGINGVWTDGSNWFYVGVQGFTMHSTAPNESGLSYTPAVALTTATLHGVGGAESTVVATGGELGVADTTQRAVILVRGDSSTTFTFDGTAYMATGDLRTSLGGTGQ